MCEVTLCKSDLAVTLFSSLSLLIASLHVNPQDADGAGAGFFLTPWEKYRTSSLDSRREREMERDGETVTRVVHVRVCLAATWPGCLSSCISQLK